MLVDESPHLSTTSLLLSPEKNVDIVGFVHPMHGTHKNKSSLKQTKDLKRTDRQPGLFAIEALKAFLCPLVHEGTRLASALCSKHGQGRGTSSACIRVQISYWTLILSRIFNGRAMRLSRCDAGARDKHNGRGHGIVEIL